MTSTITDVMRARHAVRSYTGEPLTDVQASSIEDFIAATAPPFGARAQITLVKDAATPLGTMGSVKGAVSFMGLVFPRPGPPLAEEGAAYWFEQVILHCTKLGLGTVWLAGFSRSSFDGHVTLDDGEVLAYACPVGLEGGAQPLIDRLRLRKPHEAHGNKKPFEALFLNPDGSALAQANAGPYGDALEMVRIAPSARNLQPVRVIKDEGTCHFAVVPEKRAHTDAGIALCHFELTCKEQGIPGSFEPLADTPTPPHWQYITSWVPTPRPR
ncbi:MAG: hypothetical protein FWD59_05585 [Micrococcales bacterium]|nr:hypothetical protein [Micrococcales bacterium]